MRAASTVVIGIGGDSLREYIQPHLFKEDMPTEEYQRLNHEVYEEVFLDELMNKLVAHLSQDWGGLYIEHLVEFIGMIHVDILKIIFRKFHKHSLMSDESTSYVMELLNKASGGKKLLQVILAGAENGEENFEVICGKCLEVSRKSREQILLVAKNNAPLDEVESKGKAWRELALFFQRNYQRCYVGLLWRWA